MRVQNIITMRGATAIIDGTQIEGAKARTYEFRSGVGCPVEGLRIENLVLVTRYCDIWLAGTAYATIVRVLIEARKHFNLEDEP